MSETTPTTPAPHRPAIGPGVIAVYVGVLLWLALAGYNTLTVVQVASGINLSLVILAVSVVGAAPMLILVPLRHRLAPVLSAVGLSLIIAVLAWAAFTQMETSQALGSSPLFQATGSPLDGAFAEAFETQNRRSSWRIAIAIAVMLLAGLAAIYLLRSEQVRKAFASDAELAAEAATPQPSDAIRRFVSNQPPPSED